MKAVKVVETIDDAWLATLELVDREPEGQLVHVVTTVRRPVADDLQCITGGREFQDQLDKQLLGRHPEWQPVDTVAETIFPDSLYRWDYQAWHPDLELGERLALEQRAEELFAEYKLLLPLIRRAKANRDRWHGTYFGRLVDWDGYNQLAYWISALRKKRTQRISSFKEVNFALAGEGELALGGQLRAATDRSNMGGPCLVHIDLSLVESRLHLLANYRHWFLQERAYGNLVGLANLQRFVCQQTGYLPGELVVVSGVANAQHDKGGRRAVGRLVENLRQLGLAE